MESILTKFMQMKIKKPLHFIQIRMMLRLASLAKKVSVLHLINDSYNCEYTGKEPRSEKKLVETLSKSELRCRLIILEFNSIITCPIIEFIFVGFDKLFIATPRSKSTDKKHENRIKQSTISPNTIKSLKKIESNNNTSKNKNSFNDNHKRRLLKILKFRNSIFIFHKGKKMSTTQNPIKQ